MRKFLVGISILATSIVFSQHTIVHEISTPDTSTMRKILEKSRRHVDSLKSAQADREVMQGINNLLLYQGEDTVKQRKKAFLYIGLGIFLLVILIAGLRRKVKK